MPSPTCEDTRDFLFALYVTTPDGSTSILRRGAADSFGEAADACRRLSDGLLDWREDGDDLWRAHDEEGGGEWVVVRTWRPPHDPARAPTRAGASFTCWREERFPSGQDRVVRGRVTSLDLARTLCALDEDEALEWTREGDGWVAQTCDGGRYRIVEERPDHT